MMKIKYWQLTTSSKETHAQCEDGKTKREVMRESTQNSLSRNISTTLYSRHYTNRNQVYITTLQIHFLYD